MKKFLIVLALFCWAAGMPSYAQTEELVALFPDIKNLPKYGDPLVFSPETLYEYINGAAEIYLRYDFQELVVQEYENDAGAFLTIEIYRHNNPLNAFGTYSQERPFAGDFLEIGTQGYYENSMLNFLKGSYYVKLNSYGLEASEEATLKSIAKDLAGKLDGTTEFPKELAYFPEYGKIRYTEQYLAQDFLGYAFLQSAFTTNYADDDQVFQMFLILCDSSAECEAMLKDYAHEVAIDPATIVEGPVVFDDAYHGQVEMRWRDRYIWGVKGLDDADPRKKALDRTEKRLIE